jgi:hypothetical protein
MIKLMLRSQALRKVPGASGPRSSCQDVSSGRNLLSALGGRSINPSSGRIFHLENGPQNRFDQVQIRAVYSYRVDNLVDPFVPDQSMY